MSVVMVLRAVACVDSTRSSLFSAPPGMSVNAIIAILYAYLLLYCALLYAHLVGLSTRETVALPGGGTTTKVTKVVEQRMTNFGIHLLIAICLLFAPALRIVRLSTAQ